MQYNQILMADEGDVIALKIGIGNCGNCGTLVFGKEAADYIATNEWNIRNGELARIFVPAPETGRFCSCSSGDRIVVYTGIYPKVVPNAT